MVLVSSRAMCYPFGSSMGTSWINHLSAKCENMCSDCMYTESWDDDSILHYDTF